ncbi:MAG TPA: right-handed parallel beta-helix repeat-containing protein, partial [Candidatus Hydrogenedentes bacterium]|nr:right-handed parallel beta-helix repeat-containing protein [Candidatus Hydrogenedentota bacterium]
FKMAIPYRAQSYEYLGNGETESIFEAVKTLLVDGELVGVGLPIYRPNASTPGRFDTLTLTDNEYQMPAPEDVYLAGYHALAIVGYDESRFGGQGGYKIINSWGDAWGNHGFAWLSQSFLTSFGFEFYTMADRIGYAPVGMLHFKVSHDYWWYDNITVTVGVGPEAAPFWSKEMNKRLDRDALTMDRWADITDAEMYLPPDWTNRWWLKVSDFSALDVALLSAALIEFDSQGYGTEIVLPLQGPFRGGDLLVYMPLGEAASSNYYVNDDYDEDSDIYCTTSGNDANDGLTPATPKRNIQAIIDFYTLKGGDVVWIDTGTYDLAADISLNYLDQGLSGNPIRFAGVTKPNGEPGTIFQRQGTTGASFNLSNGTRNVQVERMWLTGGANGVYCDGWWAYWNEGLIFQDIRISNVQNTGCYFEETYGCTLRRCEISGFSEGPGIDIFQSSAIVDQCTVVAGSGKTCIAVHSTTGDYDSESNLSLTNSILQTSLQGGACVTLGYFSSASVKYNDLYATGGATPGLTLDDTNIQTDPLFADPENGDFYVKSAAGRWDPAANGATGGWVVDSMTSPLIDTGDPGIPVGNEPSPNGGRVNIGSHGGTAYASKTPAVWRHVILDSPSAGVTYRRTCRIAWQFFGNDWQPGDTLLLEYSDDAGQRWNPIAGAGALPYDAYSWIWDISGLAPGSIYEVRITSNQDPAVTWVTDNFSIAAPRTFYVNDAYTMDDSWCTAGGNDANNGTSTATPKATLTALLSSVDLEPGDLVCIDTGTYSTAADIVVSTADGGSTAAPVIFQGSPQGTVLQRTVVSGNVIVLNASYTEWHDLSISGAANGVYAKGDNNSFWKVAFLNNSQDGLRTDRANDTVSLYNCRFVQNGRTGIYLAVNGGETADAVCDIVNTTFIGNLNGVYMGFPSSVGIRNSIIIADGASSYGIYLNAVPTLFQSDNNDLFATNGAKVGFSAGMARGTLSEWQLATGKDLHSISTDPLLVDAPNGDYHLQSTGGSWHGGAWTADTADSPCLDTGDPADPVALEPEPNGGRINMGDEGGTDQASKTPAVSLITLLAPHGGEVWRGSQYIRWYTGGAGWQTDDTVRIEYSLDSGATWSPIAGADSISYRLGSFLWETTEVENSVHCRIRVICNRDELLQDSSETDFAILRNFYVNDAYDPMYDTYCTAPGSDLNDGVLPSAPKATIQAILDVYDLEPGDTVYIDTGTYESANDITVTAADSGAANNPIVFQGSSKGTLLQRTNTGSNINVVALQASCTEWRDMTVTGGTNGILLTGANSAILRMVFKLNNYGITFGGGAGSQILYSLFTQNNTAGIYLNAVNSPFEVHNCTFVGNPKGLSVSQGDESQPAFTNCIFCVDGTSGYCLWAGVDGVRLSDYNDFWTTNGAKVGRIAHDIVTINEWRSVTGQDEHSISVNPLFVDAATGDYHVQSTEGSWHGGAWTADASDSPCVDAGDPADAVGDEPEPNGQRINQGAYGGTNQASKTSSKRLIMLAAPSGGEVWSGTQNIRWTTTGCGWQAPDTLKVEYSEDGGVTWAGSVPGGDAVPYSVGSLAWDTTSVPSGALYRIRLTCNENPETQVVSRENFTIHNGALIYYVNDGYDPETDVYCTASGNDDNNGVTKDTPKASVQAIIGTYDLEPGDVVYVDTGTYTLQANITISAADEGVAGNPVTFVGSTNPAGTILNRNAAGSSTRVFEISGSYICLERLRCTAAYIGINLSGKGCEVKNCTVYGCYSYGINMAGDANVILDCAIFSNNGGGVYCQPSKYATAVITGSNVYNNMGDGIRIWAYYSTITVSNNLSRNNSSCGLNMTYDGSGAVTAENNTLVANGSYGVEGYYGNFWNNI